MKRKRNQGCGKETRGNNTPTTPTTPPPPQFLQGIQCHIHSVGFGSMRYKIFQNHVRQHGGELIEKLPETSNASLYVVFEEAVDEEKVKRLIDVTKLPNSIFLRCTWLVESVKSKRKAGTESHLIIPMTPEDVWVLGVKDVNGTHTEESKSTEREIKSVNTPLEEEVNEGTKTEVNSSDMNTKKHNLTQTSNAERTEIRDEERTQIKTNVTQTEKTDKTQMEEEETHRHTHKTENRETETRAFKSQPNITTNTSNEHTEKNTKTTTENQTSPLSNREEGGVTTEKEEPLNRTAAEELNRLTTGPKNEDLSNLNSPESLIRPFPKRLQDKFACARPSSSKPLNLNGHITAELEKLASTYKNTNDTWRAVGYQRAIAALRNCDKPITSREEALAIPGIGGRLADKIAEILESGRLRKVAEVCEGEEARTLAVFLGVWGAGPTTAQMWYHQGHRTLEDLRTKASLTRHQQIGLKHYDDINARIPRSEVTQIENYVREATLSIVKGAEVMVCGSYRRGKETCGDVDVLITHSDGHSHELVFKPLLARLRETGFITDDLVTQEDNGNQKKYLGVCRLPGEGRKHRRLDIIVVPYKERATAVMYFTGSAHFNRSMRLLATKKGMSLSEHSLRAGIMRQGGEKLNEGYRLDTPTEASIFTHLGLEYRPPQERDH